MVPNSPPPREPARAAFDLARGPDGRRRRAGEARQIAIGTRRSAGNPHAFRWVWSSVAQRAAATLAGALLAVVLSLVGSPAAVAGGSWLELQGGDDVLVPGEVVTMSGTFGSGQQAAVSAGPWQAQLRLEGEGGSPVPLGSVVISESSKWGWRATVTFTVPTVPTGDYWVSVVNDEGEGVGDLVGGFVHVAPSAEAWRLSLLRQRLDRQQQVARKEMSEMRDRLAGARADLAEATDARDQLADRVGELERARDVAQAASATDDPATVPWLAAAGAIAVLALILGIAALRRRGGGAVVTANRVSL